jgi:hypothetical protein
VQDAEENGPAGGGRAEAFRWAREAMRRNAEAIAREEALRNPPPTPPQAPPPSAAPPSAAPPTQPVESSEPVVDASLQPALEVQWQQLDEARRDLLAEWSRLSRARERIEQLYEHLDDMRRQLEVERRALVVQSEQVWIERFQPTRLPDRPWRDAAGHVLEAAVIVRAAIAQRAPELMAGLRGRAQRRGALIVRRKELPPGGST